MTASLNVRRSSIDNLIITISFISLIFWIFPGMGKAYAKTVVPEKSLIFEIKSQDEIQNQKEFAEKYALEQAQQQQAIAFAKIDKKVSLVRNYLNSKNSPFANYTEILLAQNNWKTIIAISNAESNMGKHCYLNNCSGIGGQSGLKAYNSVPDWIVDMNYLINQRYAGMNLNQMDGIYVQPRSANWLNASGKVYQDLTNIETQFPQ